MKVRLSVLAFAVLLASATASFSADAPSTQWPMFHMDRNHSGVSAETALTATNVSSLGVDWVANTGGPAYTSPVVAYNAQLARTLVYVGNQNGTFAAYDADTGDRIWYFKTASAVQSTAAVSGGVVYVGSSDHNLYALNAATGQMICSFDSGGVISSSPLVVDPDGTGKVVYFGDNGLTGADDGGDEWAINAVDPNVAADCSLKWRFTGFDSPRAGSWSPPAFGRDSSGRPLVVFGSSDPDDSVYALDAVTGAKVWRYQGGIGTDTDIGAGPTITGPGVNGFPDGEVYVSSKYREVYAINLKTGVGNWLFSIRTDSPKIAGAPRSTAAILGNSLFLGYGAGIYRLNAVTGTKVWKTTDFNPATPEVISSPAVAGPANDNVVFFGDVGGSFRAYSLSGHQLWSYNSGALVYSSPAVANGHMYIASANGLLYAFNVGGGVSGKPSTTITTPADGSTVANDGVAMNFAGSATDDLGVSKVFVAVKNTATGRWWDKASGTWSPVFQQWNASLGAPGATSTSWSATVPPPPEGGSFLVQADAVDTDGQHDPRLPSIKFTLASVTNPPDTVITTPTLRQIFHPPCCDPSTNGFFMPYYIEVAGTANDVGGANPGVRLVRVSVRNVDHGEYWCGSSGCPGNPDTFWRPTFTSVLADLSAPGATETDWTTQFLIYDHEHKYRIIAWAIDKDGYADPVRATVNRICVNDPTNNRCL